MGLFSKSKEAEVTPSITIDGIDVYYTPTLQEWEFFYRDTEFHGMCPQFRMPSPNQLDALLTDLERLMPRMIERLEDGWKDWENVSIDDGETYSLNIERFVDEGVFEVDWSGGDSWGDMGAVFTIRNGSIINEDWGD